MKLFLILFGAAALLSAADTGVRGRILDPSGDPIPGATVSITSRDSQLTSKTQSDAAGSYVFPSLSAGDYLLEARSTGTAGTAKVHIDDDRMLDLDVKVDLEKLSAQVQVTASGTAQTTDEQAKALTILTGEELDKREVYSVAEAIRYTPGIRVAQLGGPGSLTRVIARGTRAFDSSLLVDGFRLRDASSPQGEATAFLGDLLMVDSDRIEILRGSGSSLYGTNAAGSVINLVTDEGGGRVRGEISAEGGGLGEIRGLAKVAGGALQDRFRYTAGLVHLNVLSGIDGNDRYRNTAGQGFVSYSLSPTITVGGRLFASDNFTQLNTSPFALPGASAYPSGFVPAIDGVTLAASPDDPDYRRAGSYFSGLVNFQQRLSPTASYKVTYQGLTTNRENRDGPGGVSFQPAFNTSNIFAGRLDTLQARTDFQLTRWQLITGGYEYERERYDNRATDENPVIAQRVNVRVQIVQGSHAGFAQDQIRLLDGRLQISLSGRVQKFELDKPSFTGGAPLYQNVKLNDPPSAYTGDGSIAYLSASTGTKLRAHVGNGYRVPSLYERFGASFYGGSFSAYGDPLLRPDRLISVDGGFDQYLFNSRVVLRATYFYTRLQEAIVFDFSGAINYRTDPYGRFGGYRNTGGGLARGVETSAETRITRSLTLNASYTYTNARERNSSLIGGSLRALRVFDHMGTITAIQRIGKRVDVTANFLAASDYIFPLFSGSGSRPFLFPGPRKLDLALNYTHPVTDHTSVRFYTRVENALNQNYLEEGFKTPGAWAVAGVKLLF